MAAPVPMYGCRYERSIQAIDFLFDSRLRTHSAVARAHHPMLLALSCDHVVNKPYNVQFGGTER